MITTGKFWVTLTTLGLSLAVMAQDAQSSGRGTFRARHREALRRSQAMYERVPGRAYGYSRGRPASFHDGSVAIVRCTDPAGRHPETTWNCETQKRRSFARPAGSPFPR